MCFQRGSVPLSFCLPRLFLLQHLCPGLGWRLITHSDSLNLFLSLSSLHSLALSFFIQVVFVPGDRAPAVWVEPVLLWWTAGDEAEPKWSPSPSVCIHTSHMFSSRSESLQSRYTHSAFHSYECAYCIPICHLSMIFVCIGFEIILNFLLFLVCVCNVSHVVQHPEKKLHHSQILCIFTRASMHAQYVCLCFK